MVQAILYGWVMGIHKGEIEAHKGAHIRIPKFVQYMLMFVVPVYLLIIFGGFCFQSLPGYAKTIVNDSVALGSIGFILTVLIFLIIMIHIAGIRWKAEGRLNFANDKSDKASEENKR